MGEVLYPPSQFADQKRQHWLTTSDPNYRQYVLATWYPGDQVWVIGCGDEIRTYSPSAAANKYRWNCLVWTSQADSKTAKGSIGANTDSQTDLKEDVKLLRMAFALCAAWHNATQTEAASRIMNDEHIRKRWVVMAKAALYQVTSINPDTGQDEIQESPVTAVSNEPSLLDAYKDYIVALEDQITRLHRQIFGVDEGFDD